MFPTTELVFGSAYRKLNYFVKLWDGVAVKGLGISRGKIITS
jgi:hypothetical protein